MRCLGCVTFPSVSLAISPLTLETSHLLIARLAATREGGLAQGEVQSIRLLDLGVRMQDLGQSGVGRQLELLQAFSLSSGISVCWPFVASIVFHMQ